MAVTIPDSHYDLLTEPVHAVLTTMMPDGTPQSSIVWADIDKEYVLVKRSEYAWQSKSIHAYY